MIRILVITADDERTRSIVDHLQSCDACEALGAGSGNEALRQLEEDDAIQLVIADLDREDLAGDTFIRRARRRQPALSCVVLGGEQALRDLPDAETQLRPLHAEASLDEIQGCVDELVEERRGRGFHGHLQCLSLIDVIQLHCVTAKTGRLRVGHWGQHGEIYFGNGKLLHAGQGELEGPEALYRLVTWDSGTFRVDLDVLPEVDSLSHMALNALLIEATRRHDESLAPDALSGASRPDSAQSAQSAQSGQSGRSRRSGHDSNGNTRSRKLELLGPESLPRRRVAPLSAGLVNDLLAVDGVEGIFAVNRDGVVLQSEDLDDSEETLGTLAAYLGSSCEATQETLGAERFTSALAVERSGRKLLLVNTRNFYIGVTGSARTQADPLLRDVLGCIRRAASGKSRRARPAAVNSTATTGHHEETGR